MPDKILIVEDEAVTALDIQQSLRRKGYEVAGIAGSAEEALAEARAHRPDLVLMDIRLKGDPDGISAAEQIHKESDAAIVFLTAYADCATLDRAKAAEPFAYLLKPFEEEVLATTIEIALHKRKAHAQSVQAGAEALHFSEERFRQLARNVADYAVMLLNHAGQILSWNPGAETMYGRQAGEVLGKDNSILYPAEEIAGRKPDRDLQAASRTGRHMEYGCQVRKDQTRFSAEMILVPLRSTAGEIAGFLKLTREIAPGGQKN